MLRELFPDAQFAGPASVLEITSAEIELGAIFPEQLRMLYLESNGFREAYGNSAYLFPLSQGESLTTLTKFLWSGFVDVWPDLNLRPFIFFGSSSCDAFWGIEIEQPHQLVAFHHSMEGEYEILQSREIVQLYLDEDCRFRKQPLQPSENS